MPTGNARAPISPRGKEKCNSPCKRDLVQITPLTRVSSYCPPILVVYFVLLASKQMQNSKQKIIGIRQLLFP